jgi:hypothetical protein
MFHVGHHHLKRENVQIDEKGTLKATEHDKDENIAGAARLKLEMHITAHAA